jgi:HK97 family phage portal protein
MSFFDRFKKPSIDEQVKAYVDGYMDGRKTDLLQFVDSYGALVDPTQQPGIGKTYYSRSKMGYQGNADVFACVREIAVAVRGIPWVVVKPNSKGELEPSEKHPMLKLFNKPNPFMSGSMLKEWLVSYHLLDGTGYLRRVGADDSRRPPRELYLPRPDCIKANPGQVQGEVANWTFTKDDGGKEIVDSELICSFPFFNPLSEYEGMSPLDAASRGIDIGNEGRTWNRNLLRNGAKPPGMFVAKNSLTETQREQISNVIAERVSGSVNAGRPLIADNDFRYEKYGWSPTDMDWSNSIKLSSQDICKVFNVAPELIGIGETKTYSNYQEARKALYHETVLPLMDFICDEINNWLAPLYNDGALLSYDIQGIEALTEDQDSLVERLNKAWWLTPNQRLEAMGYPTIPDGDTLFVPANMVPIDVLNGKGDGKEL